MPVSTTPPEPHPLYEVLPNAVESHDSAFAVTNEKLNIIRDLIRGKRIRTAAGIASSGEVGLFCLLPSVRDSLTLVDHSRRSLECAVLRYKLLQEYSYKETIRRCGDPIQWVEEADKHGLFRAMRGRAQDRLDKTPRIRHKLDKVNFVLGSIRDLPDTYDFIYLSNAHQSHNGNHNYREGPPTHQEMAEKLNPGGWLLVCEAYTGNYSMNYQHLTCLERVSFGYNEDKNYRGCNWDYCLYQKN